MNSEANGEISNEYYKKLNQQIVQKDNLIKLLQLQIRNLKTQIDSGEDSKEADELQKALDEKKSEAEKLLEELEKQKEQFQLLEQQKDEQIKDLNRILEEQKTSEKDLQNAANPFPVRNYLVSFHEEEELLYTREIVLKYCHLIRTDSLR